jgi:integrase
MPIRTPSYRLHKARGYAVVTIDSKDRYLGAYDSPESWKKYHRLVAEWLAGRAAPAAPTVPAPVSPAPPLLVNELILKYWEFVQGYYVKDGRPTSEQDTLRQALRFVRRLYGSSAAVDFSPRSLKAVRQAMIDHPVTRNVRVKDPATGEVREETRVLNRGLSRGYINKQVGRIKRMFSWAVEEGMLPATVHLALARVAGLRKGKSDAREKLPVRPVHDEHVETVLHLVPPAVRAMIQVQRLCGGRPQDIVEMRPGDIDRSGPIREYRPGRHKTEHRGRERVVFLGPRAQELLKPFLEDLKPDEHVFSPARSETRRLAEIRARRGLPPVKPSKDRGKWALRDHYDAASYRRGVRRACRKAGIPVWFPLQLRHATGTLIRKSYGLEASQAVLGHAELSVTQVYSEVDLAAARRVMAEIG